MAHTMDLDLAGKGALVAASSRGIGFACAEALAKEGANVLICGRDPERLASASKRLAEVATGAVHAVPCDLTDAAETAALVSRAQDALGGVDVLVTNGGGPPPGSLLDLKDEQWLRSFEGLVMSAVRLSRGVIPGMVQRKFGRIVHIASITARQPVPDLVVSNALRPAILGISKTLALELAPKGVTVNVVIPGYTNTERQRELEQARAVRTGRSAAEVRANVEDLIPLGRFAEPDEIGRVVAFLASPKSGYITGQAFAADGGYVKGLF